MRVRLWVTALALMLGGAGSGCDTDAADDPRDVGEPDPTGQSEGAAGSDDDGEDEGEGEERDEEGGGEEDEGDSEPDGCVSEVATFGLVCTSCPSCSSDDGPETECLPADCVVREADGCLSCDDDRGRTVVDCSLDWVNVSLSRSGFGGGTFNACSTTWGDTIFSGTTCWYPGVDTCAVTQKGDGLCLECFYPDGSGKWLCTESGPLPDPLDGRPDDLPPPGECVTEEREGGRVLCTTCTHADLSAFTSCRHPQAEVCDIDFGGDEVPGRTCMTCTGEDGASATFCDPP